MAKRVRAVSAGEWELLEILWRLGPATLAAVHAAFGRAVGYTTVQTRLNRLAEKGLAERGDSRPATYAAAITRSEAERGAAGGLLARLAGLGGSVVPVVAELVADRRLSADEIAALRELLDQAEAAQQEEEA